MHPLEQRQMPLRVEDGGDLGLGHARVAGALPAASPPVAPDPGPAAFDDLAAQVVLLPGGRLAGPKALLVEPLRALGHGVVLVDDQLRHPAHHRRLGVVDDQPQMAADPLEVEAERRGAAGPPAGLDLGPQTGPAPFDHLLPLELGHRRQDVALQPTGRTLRVERLLHRHELHARVHPTRPACWTGGAGCDRTGRADAPPPRRSDRPGTPRVARRGPGGSRGCRSPPHRRTQPPPATPAVRRGNDRSDAAHRATCPPPAPGSKPSHTPQPGHLAQPWRHTDQGDLTDPR